MLERELKLDPLLTKNFFSVPPQEEPDVKLNFPLPTDKLELPNFLKAHGRSSTKKSFYNGVLNLIANLRAWCDKFIATEFDFGMHLKVLSNHFEYDGNGELSYNAFIFSLYTNGVVYLANLNNYISLEKYPLEFRKQVIRQLMQTLRVDEPCAGGCNTILEKGCQQFSSKLPSQLMHFRTQVAENVMIKKLAKVEAELEERFKKGEKVKRINKAMLLHYQICGLVYFKNALGVSCKEQPDIYCQQVLNILEQKQEITKELKDQYPEYIVAEIVRDEFPKEIQKELTSETLIDHLFTLSIPISKKKTKLENAVNQVTLQSALDNLFLEAENAEFIYTEANAYYESLCVLLNYFGEDKEFSFEEIFTANNNNNATLNSEATYVIVNPRLIRDAIEISLLHRLEFSWNFLSLKLAVVTNLQNAKLYFFPEHSLSFSFVRSLEDKTRIPYLEYVLKEVQAEDYEKAEIALKNIFKTLSSSKQIELLEKIINFLFVLKKMPKMLNNLWDGIVHAILSDSQFITKFIFNIETKANLMEVAAKHGKLDFFKTITESASFTAKKSSSITVLFARKNIPFSAHAHKALNIAMEKGHWEIVTLILSQYKFTKLKLKSISNILIVATLCNHIPTIDAYFELEQELLKAEKDVKQDLHQEYLVKNELVEKILKVDSSNPILIKVLIEFFYLRLDVPGIVKTLNQITQLQLDNLMMLKLNNESFFEYCFMQSTSTLQFLDDKADKENSRKLLSLESVLEKIIKFKDPINYILFLLRIYDNDSNRILKILKKSHALKNINLDEIILLGALSIPNPTLQRTYVNDYALPYICRFDQAVLLKKLFDQDLFSYQGTSSDLISRFKLDKAWGCFWVFYEKKPEFFEVEDIIPFEAAQAKRFDIVKLFYEANPLIQEEIFEHYDPDVKTFVETNANFKIEILLLLDICKDRCMLDFKTWTPVLQSVLQSIPNLINEVVFLVYKNQICLLQHLFQAELIEFIIPYLTDNVLTSSEFLNLFKQLITQTENNSKYWDALLKNPHVLNKMFSVDSCLKEQFIIVQLLRHVQKTTHFYPNGVAEVIRIHNQFASYTGFPEEIMLSLLSKLVLLNSTAVIKEIFNPESKNNLYKGKVNKSQYLNANENDLFLILFKSIDIILKTDLNDKPFHLYFETFPQKIHNEFIMRLLQLRPHLRQRLCDREELLTLLLNKMSPMKAEAFFMDDAIKPKFIELLNRAQNKVRLSSFLALKAFYALEDQSYRKALTLFLIKNSGHESLRVALALHEDPVKTFKNQPAEVQRFLIKGAPSYTESGHFNALIKYYNLLNDIIAEADETNNTLPDLLIWRARLGIIAIQCVPDKVDLKQVASAIERIEKFKDLNLPIPFKISSFYWKYYPNDASKIQIACQLRLEAFNQGHVESKEILQEYLRSILKVTSLPDDLNLGVEQAIKKLCANPITDFQRNLKLLTDCLSISLPNTQAGLFSQTPFTQKTNLYKSFLNLTNSDLEKKIIIYLLLSENPSSLDKKFLTEKMGFTHLESPMELLERSILFEITINSWHIIKGDFILPTLTKTNAKEFPSKFAEEIITDLRTRLVLSYPQESVITHTSGP